MTPTRFETKGFDRQRLVALMREKRIDAILLATPENVYYTTGYPCLPSSGNPILYALKNQFPFFALITADGRVSLVPWIGVLLGGVEFAVDHVQAYLDRAGALEALKSLLAAQGLVKKTIGIESECPSFASRLVEDACGPAALVVIDDIMQTLRLVKSPEEIEMIKKSTAIAEATIGELIGIIRPGIRRPDLIGEAKYRMIRNGATGVGHTTISFGTSNPEVSIDEALEKEKLVAIDIGASYHGYLSDVRRHVYTGAVPDHMYRLHATMCGIVAEVGGMLRPGITAQELYEHALSLYEKNGVSPFIINVGHSIGLQTEEAWIYRGTDLVIAAGMVVNIELYTSYEEGVEVGDEETYLVTDGEPVRLTALPPEIVSV
jgi:Xaa-Pro aminopeptidase